MAAIEEVYPQQHIYGLQALKDTIIQVFGSQDAQSAESCYRIFIEERFPRNRLSRENMELFAEALEIRGRKPTQSKERVLNFWCFNSGLALQRLIASKSKPPQCIILTSGTLSPMDATAAELGLEFPIRLENPHVIQKDQICVLVSKAGPSGEPFDSRNTNRENEKYLSEIGSTICT